MTRGIVCLLIGLVLVVSSTALAAAEEPVVDYWELAALYPLSGGVAWAGQGYKWFAEKAVEYINEAGGVRGRPIKLTIYDEAHDQTRAASVGAKAIASTTLVILTGTSVCIQTVGPMAKKHGVPMYSPWAGKEDVGKSGPWFVSFGPSTEWNQKFLMNAWLDQISDVKTAVVLKLPTIGQWVAAAEAEVQSIEERGVKVVDNIDVASPVVDASSLVIRILDKGADAVALHVIPADGFRIIQELKARGFTDMGKIIVNEAAATAELLEMASEAGNAVDGIYCEGPWNNRSNPLWQRLLKEWQAVPGNEDLVEPGFMAYAFVDVYMFKHIVEELQLTGDPNKLAEERTKIKDWLNTVEEYDYNIWGKAKRQPSGEFAWTWNLYRIQNNKKVDVINSDDYYK